MQGLMRFGILVGLLSCSPMPHGTEKRSPPDSNLRGEENAQKQSPNVSIQRADVNEDGEVNILDMNAVAYYMGQKVPANAATWWFSDEKITVGEIFSVRVDVMSQIKEQMDFELKQCGDLFVAGGDRGEEAITVHGTVGSIENLIILNDTGHTDLPVNNEQCTLQTTVIRRSDGKTLGTFTKKLQLERGIISLRIMDFTEFRHGRISAAVTVKRKTNATKRFIGFSVCRVSDYICSVVGKTEYIEYGAHGAVESLQLKKQDGSRISNLSSGKYLVVVGYVEKGEQNGETLRLAATAVEID